MQDARQAIERARRRRSHDGFRHTCRENLEQNAYVDPHGIYRWSSNNQVPPTELLAEAIVYDGFSMTEEELAQHIRARDADTNDFLTQYRKNYTGPSVEERMEARAAFGPGQTIVNVITGHKFRT